jgi:hypothetical protein
VQSASPAQPNKPLMIDPEALRLGSKTFKVSHGVGGVTATRFICRLWWHRRYQELLTLLPTELAHSTSWAARLPKMLAGRGSRKWDQPTLPAAFYKHKV